MKRASPTVRCARYAFGLLFLLVVFTATTSVQGAPAFSLKTVEVGIAPANSTKLSGPKRCTILASYSAARVNIADILSYLPNGFPTEPQGAKYQIRGLSREPVCYYQNERYTVSD